MKTIVLAIAAALVVSFDVRPASAHPADPLINSLYMKYLGRFPNPEARALLRQRLAYMPVVAIEARLLGGIPYYERAGCDPRAFIIALYHDVLGVTQPSPEEVAFWLQRLHECRNRERLALMFLTELRGQPVPMQPPLISPLPMPTPLPLPTPTPVGPALAPPPPTPPITVSDREDRVVPRPLPTGPNNF